jgi:LPXTG-site transpeptidase (sortase) family protein
MNQILISKKIYVTKEMKRKRMLYKTIYILSIILIFTLLVYYVFAERLRNNQEALGKEILSKLDDNTTISDNAIVVALDNNQEDDNMEIVPNNNNSSSDQITEQITTSDGNKYTTEAVLSYPKLGIDYPVLADENDKLLKVSLCKYWGPQPNEIGNYCIVGHNYKSGRMFGKLSMASNGDEVTLKSKNKSVKYKVYNMYKVEPTDVSCTSQLTNGKREITLITCTNFGKQRLVVKAREI